MEATARKHGDYIIESDKQFPTMKRIRFDGSGSVHLELRGMYTSPQSAMDAINAHLDKSKADANEAESASGSEELHTGAADRDQPPQVPAERDDKRAELRAKPERNKVSKTRD